MRFVALAIIIACLPIIIGWIGQDVRRRDLAILMAGMLMLCTGPIDPSAALLVWPAWQGLSKGIFLSVIDCIAIALIATRPKQNMYRPFIILFAVFAFPILLSVTQAPVKQASFFLVAQILQMILFYIAFSGELRRPTAITSLLKGVSLGLMIQAGYVISQKASGAIQASGTMAHQNILGIIVELAALPLLAAVLEGERSKLIYGGLLSALIIIAGGGSRGTMLYFAIGAALVLILSLIRRNTARKWQMLGMSALACLLAAPLAVNTLNERFGGASVIQQETERAAFERAARAMAADNWLGVGANNFVSVNNLQGYAARAGLDWAPSLRSKPAHNAYLVARAETGWAGELALIVLLVGLIVTGLRTAFRTRKLPVLGIPVGCAAAVTAAAFHSNYEYAIYLLETQRFLFMNAALIAGCIEIARRARAGRRKAAAVAPPQPSAAQPASTA